jgi:hypothetical protein
MLLNVLFSEPPIEFTAATITIEIPAAMMAYSMEVAPASSARKRRTSFLIGISPRILCRRHDALPTLDRRAGGAVAYIQPPAAPLMRDNPETGPNSRNAILSLLAIACVRHLNLFLNCRNPSRVLGEDRLARWRSNKEPQARSGPTRLGPGCDPGSGFAGGGGKAVMPLPRAEEQHCGKGVSTSFSDGGLFALRLLNKSQLRMTQKQSSKEILSYRISNQMKRHNFISLVCFAESWM